MTDHYQYIQNALEIRAQSKHETHKVGAVIVSQEFEIAHPNYYPAPLEHTIGHHQKLGNASTTVHAEIAAILQARFPTDKAKIYITQRPCPNCAKAIIEAGIKEVYVSAETRNTVLGKKIQPFFENASLPFLTYAGVSVFEIGEKIIPLNTALKCNDDGLKPQPFNADFDHAVSQQVEPFAACIAHDKTGNRYFLHAQAKVPHCLPQERVHEISNIQQKYETALQPINRLLMICARYGLQMDQHDVYSSRTPTSREFVNFIGAGYSALRIGNESICRDASGLTALRQIKDHNILNVFS